VGSNPTRSIFIILVEYVIELSLFWSPWFALLNPSLYKSTSKKLIDAINDNEQSFFYIIFHMGKNKNILSKGK
jgi:hypothetical protein